MSNIIIADDVEAMRRLLHRIVTDQGHQGFPLKSGQDVVKFLNETELDIHLALIDISMPGMTGIETVQQMSKISPTTKVCFVSGVKDKQTVLQAINKGGHDYVVKPVDVPVIKNKITTLLGGSASESFAAITTQLNAQIPNFPFMAQFVVTELTEAGLTLKSNLQLIPDATADLDIPTLAKALEFKGPFSIKVEKVSKKSSEFSISCSFYGLHESVRTRLRSLTTRGAKLNDDPVEENSAELGLTA